MLTKLTSYFNIESTDVDHIAILTNILDFCKHYLATYGVDVTDETSAIIFYCAVDLYSSYLKTGNDQFQVAQAPVPQEFSPSTLQMLRAYVSVRAF